MLLTFPICCRGSPSLGTCPHCGPCEPCSYATVSGRTRLPATVCATASLSACAIVDIVKCLVTPPVSVVAINDPELTPAQMAYLFKHDSTHGVYSGEITTMGSCLIIDGHRMECTQENEPNKIPWEKNCTEYVVESSGKFTSCAEASGHAAKRVIITADSEDAPIFIMGVNQDCFSSSMKAVAAGSDTTNALAPLLKAVHESFEIKYCAVTSVHSTMRCQQILDGSNGNHGSNAKNWSSNKWCLLRGGFQNVITIGTTASEGIQKVYPELQGNISIRVFRVPVPNGSILDLTAQLGKDVSMEKIKFKMSTAATTYLKGILGYTEQPLVSSDYIGDSRSCIFDFNASVVVSRCFVKFVAWYDNEYGYACRVVDLANYIASREEC